MITYQYILKKKNKIFIRIKGEQSLPLLYFSPKVKHLPKLVVMLFIFPLLLLLVIIRVIYAFHENLTIIYSVRQSKFQE